MPFEESVGALSELRDEGKVRHVGLSNVGRSHIDTAQEIVPIVSVQNRYSLTARDSEEVLQKCEQEGLGFIPWFPLDAGRHRAGTRSRTWRAKHSATPMQVALAWLLAHSPAMLPIPGTSSIAAPRGERRGRGVAADDERPGEARGSRMSPRATSIRGPTSATST